LKRELALARWCEKKGCTPTLFHYAGCFVNPGIDEAAAKEAIKRVDMVSYEGKL